MKSKVIMMSMLFTALVMAVSGVSAEPGVDPLVNQLTENIRFPEQLKNQNGKAVVYVAFTVDANGKVTVQRTNASDRNINSYVVEQLRLMTLSTTDLEQGQTYYVKFNFKLIN